MGQITSTFWSSPTERGPATRKYMVVNRDELHIIDEIVKNGPPHISAPFRPAHIVRNHDLYGCTCRVRRRVPANADETRIALMKNAERERMFNSITVDPFQSGIGRETHMLCDANFREAFARRFRLPLNTPTSTSMIMTFTPPRGTSGRRLTEEERTAANFSTLRELLQSLGQAEGCEAKDKELFQAVAVMSEKLESDWGKLQQMKTSFKNASEYSERRQREDRQLIVRKEAFISEVAERLEWSPSFVIRRRIESTEKMNEHLERRSHSIQSSIRAYEAEIKELKAQLETQ